MTLRFSDHRDAAFGALVNSLEEGFPLMVLTNDMGAFGLDALAEQFPDRVLNVGIQEQNLVSVASGLALSGVTPVIFGIASHLIGRAYEQVRLDLAYARVHSIVLSVGPGLTYGVDGPTHQALHEPAMLRTLPGVTYTYPTHPDETHLAVLRALHGRGLQWISLDKHVLLAPESKEVSVHYGWKHIRRDSSVLLISFGSAIEMVAECARHHRVDCAQLTQVMPVPAGFAEVLSAYERVVLVEETSWPGILSGIFQSSSDDLCWPSFTIVTLPLETPLGHWSREEAWRELSAKLKRELE